LLNSGKFASIINLILKKYDLISKEENHPQRQSPEKDKRNSRGNGRGSG
jgi:septin family protein